MASFWDNFTNTLSTAAHTIVDPIGGAVGGAESAIGSAVSNLSAPSIPSLGSITHAIGTGVGAVVSGAEKLVGYQPQTTQLTAEQALKKKAQDKLAELAQPAPDTSLLHSGVIPNPFLPAVAKSGDAMLYVAKEANAKIISPVLRAVSTAAIVADPNSDLYKAGQYKKGFQLQDIVSAWDRSKNVSQMDALASNSFFTSSALGGAVQMLSDKFNGPNFSKVNVFSDKSIQQSYHDNIFGKYFTGVGDVVTSSIELAGAGKVIGALGKLAATSSGLTAGGDLLAAATKFEADATNGITHIGTAGTQGSKTVAGEHMVKMAQSSDPSTVYKTFSKYSNNPDLLPFVTVEKDPKKIADLILADNGYLPAMERVLVDNKVAAYASMGGSDALKSKLFENYGAYQPEGEAMTRLRDVFQKSIDDVPGQRTLYNALMDTTKKDASYIGGEQPNMLGLGKYPWETVVGRSVNNVSGWTENVLGSHNNVVTRLITYTGTRVPRGYVSFSGTRPWDGITELNAAFDSVRMFHNPDNIVTVGVGKTMSVKAYRAASIAQYANATTPLDRYAAIKEIDSNIGKHIAMTKGFYDGAKTDQVISDLQNRVYGGHSTLTQKGYAIDHQGSMVELDPKTQSQLANSYRMVPWHLIEKELNLQASHGIEHVGLSGIQKSNTLFNEINKFWALDVIGKPSYVPKQSILEPLVGAWISAGTTHVLSNIPNAVTNFLSNTTNRIMEAAIKSGQLAIGQRKAVSRTLADLSGRLDQAIARRDDLYKEYQSFFVDNAKSPVTKSVYGEQVAKELRDANKIVSFVEDQYRSAVKPWGKVETIPNEVTLQRRIDYLKNLPRYADGRGGVALANAQAAISKARGSINTLLPSPEEFYAHNVQFQRNYQEIDQILTKLKGAHKAHADVFGMTEKYKARTYGKANEYRMIGNEYMNANQIFGDNAFGAALRDETSNASTVARTYASELNVGVKSGILRRHSPMTVTNVNDPLYFEELAYMVNRTWRQDKFIKAILMGQDKESLVQWGKSPEGIAYFKDFYLDNAADVPSRVDDIYNMVQRYIPNTETQKLIASQEVLSTQLQKGLANKIDVLSAIHPQDFRYEVANSNGTSMGGISKWLDQRTNAIFHTLMSPENPLRWAYVQKTTADIMASKANMLVKQGVQISTESFNALKKSAVREAVKDTEKTFYTVQRANRVIYSARIATAFPTATFNAAYRYARFAVKYPVRSLGFLHSYNSMFTSFGVDQYGNPVKDVLDAQYIIVPGTKEMGWFGGEGARLNVRSIGFMLNTPNPSPYVAAASNAIVQHMPKIDTTLQHVLGPAYSTFFPYGVNATDVRTSMLPSYIRDGFDWTQGPAGKAAFLNSWRSVYDYHVVLNSMGIEKKMPNDTQILKETRGLWHLKAVYEFASPFGFPVKMDTTPMSLYDQVYYGLVNKYKAQGLSSNAASTNAGVEFLATMGSKFPLDTITFTGSNARVKIAPTQEGYARVFQDNKDLTQQLVNIFPSDPSVVGLLTADIDVTSKNRSPVITGLLKDQNLQLPAVGGTVPFNGPRLTPMQIETQRKNNATWNAYFVAKDALDTLARTTPNHRGGYYKSAASIPGWSAALTKYATDVLGKKNPTWLSQDYLSQPQNDKSFIYAKALSLITNNQKFMLSYGGGKFWQDAQNFTNERNLYVQTYQNPPTGYKKADVQRAWTKYIGDNIDQFDPKLQRIISMRFANDTMKSVE